ncbi:MAG: serine hydrolase [Actinobacteria bacterium]|nr:serine hydrolase [Actinomycetota bacterium]
MHCRHPRLARARATSLLLVALTVAACGDADSTTESPASTVVATEAAATTGAIGPASTGPTAADTTSTDTGPTGSIATPSPVPPAGTPVSPAPIDGIDARTYGVYDLSAGRWLAGSGVDTPAAVGSIMKLLTAYVVMQAGDPGRVVTVPPLALDPMESAIGLYEGEQLPRDVLLRAMLIVSANDAARVLAQDVGDDEATFVQMMNQAAQQLGLTGTVAGNPTGLDTAGAQSTVRDIVSLSSTLLQDESFRTTAARTSARLHGETIPASNDLLTTYAGADGIKTGTTTEAGHCLAASATRDGRQIVVVVLGSASDESRVAAASSLLDWAFTQP